jgi:hypothetical protein
LHSELVYCWCLAKDYIGSTVASVNVSSVLQWQVLIGRDGEKSDYFALLSLV